MELQDNIFYTPSEFAKLRNCSVPTALSIYNLQDFPSENFGKEKVALGSAIREWYKKKREKGEILVMRSFRIYSLFYISCSIVGHSHGIVHYTLISYS